MAGRDSDVDLRDVLPGIEDILREADPKRREEKLRQAVRESGVDLRNYVRDSDPTLPRDPKQAPRESDVDLSNILPDLEAILREARPGRAQEKLRNTSLTPLPGAPGTEARLAQQVSASQRAEARVSAPSPWAKGAPGEGALDKAALPSATMPVETTPTEIVPTEATLTERTPGGAARAKTPPMQRRVKLLISMGAVIAVFGPLVMMYVLLVLPKERESGYGAATASAMAAPPQAIQSASAIVSAKPSATTDPGGTPDAASAVAPTAPMASAAPTTSAAALAPSIAPTPRSIQPSQQPRPRAPAPPPTAPSAPATGNSANGLPPEEF